MTAACSADETVGTEPTDEVLNVVPPGTAVCVLTEGRTRCGMVVGWRVSGDGQGYLRLGYDVYTLDHRGEGLLVEAEQGQVSMVLTRPFMQVRVARQG